MNGKIYCAFSCMRSLLLFVEPIRWKMLDTLLLVLLIVGVSVLLLGVRVFFVKGGKFPNTHVSGNKALRKKGIGCVQSQDREARRKPRFSIDELEKALNEGMN